MASLLVLAAGWGQRFGAGLKQLAQVGPDGEYLLDYALHDAVRAGFDRAVFVLRQDMADDFDARLLSRWRGRLPVDIVLQELSDVPQGVCVDPRRSRPWGTLHAVWCARHAVDTAFAVINADDFYGAESFSAVARFLAQPPAAAPGRIQGCMAGYAMAHTLSAHGGVNRGVCTVVDGMLHAVHEFTQIARTADGALSGVDARGVRVPVAPDACASMNFWGWTGPVFDSMGEHLRDFFLAHGTDPAAEAFMAHWWEHVLRAGRGQCHVLPTPARWSGITYAQDLALARARIAREISAGHYPQRLWPGGARAAR